MRMVIVFSLCFVQVAARCFCIPVSKIHLNETSTNTVPNSTPTAASASTDLNGMAVKVSIYDAFVGQSGLATKGLVLEKAGCRGNSAF